MSSLSVSSFNFLRGEVYWVCLDPARGMEMGKTRPAVIVQNNTGNLYSPVLIVVPISTVKEITKPLPIMVFLKEGDGGLKEDSYADCGQIRTVDKKRVADRMGMLSTQLMDKIDKALKLSLSLP